MEIGSHPPSTKEITKRERPDGSVEELSRATAYYPSWEGRGNRQKKNCIHFSICACHPCAGAMLIFSVSFQF